MALIQFGSNITGMRGKLGGHVFQYNRKGSFVRTNAIPRLNNNARGSLLRNNMSAVAAMWQSMTPARRAAWAAECVHFTFYNKFGDAFTPNAYQLFTYAELQFAALGLAIVDTIPVGGSIANIISVVYDVDISAETFNVNFIADPYGVYYTVFRVTKLSNGGNELTGLPFNYCFYYNGVASNPMNFYPQLLAHFGSNLIAGKCFKVDIETIRHPGFAPGGHFSQIININP